MEYEVAIHNKGTAYWNLLGMKSNCIEKERKRS